MRLYWDMGSLSLDDPYSGLSHKACRRGTTHPFFALWCTFWSFTFLPSLTCNFTLKYPDVLAVKSLFLAGRSPDNIKYVPRSRGCFFECVFATWNLQIAIPPSASSLVIGFLESQISARSSLHHEFSCSLCVPLALGKFLGIGSCLGHSRDAYV